MDLTRRKLLTGLIAAPIVVRAGLIMPVKAIEPFSFAESCVYGVRSWPQTWTIVRYTWNSFGHVRTEIIEPDDPRYPESARIAA